MVDGAVFALAQQRGARQHNGQDGNVVNDLYHRQKPSAFQIGVEQCPAGDQGRGFRRCVTLAGIVEQLTLENLPDIPCAHKGLTHGGGIDVDLQAGLATCQQVGLEVGRYIDHKGVLAVIHGLIELVIRQGLWGFELRGQQRLTELA